MMNPQMYYYPAERRSVNAGVIGGIIGGMIFAIYLGLNNNALIISALFGSTSMLAGILVHMLISIFSGFLFGLLVSPYIRRGGDAIAYGIGYGFFWWVFGVVILSQVIQGLVPIFGSIEHISLAMPALWGHILFGMFLGLSVFAFRK